MKILVTGASGFLGSRLVALLLAQGHEVACLWHRTVTNEYADLANAVAGENGEGIQELFSSFRPDVVVHLAASYVAEHEFGDIKALVAANVEFGAYILEAMKLADVKFLVYAGTSWQHYQNKEYCPANLYAATKQAFSTLADFYLDTSSLRILELHLYDSYGEQDKRPRLLNILKIKAEQKDELNMSAGEQQVHLVHVDDIANGFVIACQEITNQAVGERKVYRLPAQNSINLRELVERFNAINPEKTVKVHWGKKAYRQREIFKPWENAEILPGWRPIIDLDQGLRRLRGVSESRGN